MEMQATDSGALVKMEVDYSSTCDEKLPVAKKLVEEGKLQDALEMLMSLEKQTRTGADTHSTGRVLVLIVQICFDAGELEMLNENILLLTKRRSQLKQAVAKMVQECCTYVDKIPDKETKLKLIDTLRTVTAGKIYVEVERARLSHKLALIRESEGNITEAATVLQELQVETFGSMERQEKVELILEQMRFCVAKKDYIRTQIISKKINRKFFEDEKAQELKLKFFRLMIEVDQHEGSYLSICKHYKAIFNTPCIQQEPSHKKETLRHVVLYLCLSKHSNEQNDLLHRMLEEKALEEIPAYKNLLNLFLTQELIRWAGLCETYERILRNGDANNPATDVFTPTDAGEKRWQDLKNRTVEHNIRIMAKYYTKITLKRMSELLELKESETEEYLSKLVVDGTVMAKTDRLDGIVSFLQYKDPNELLNDWSHNLTELMSLVSKTTHLINKEEMIHKHMLASSE